MAKKGTPAGGLSEIAKRTYIDGLDFTLVAYTNTPDSLGPSTLAADLTQPTSANGYAPIVLNGTWSESGGVVTYDHDGSGGHPGWDASGTWSAPVTGVAIVYGTRVMHFRDYDPVGSTTWIAAAGKKLRVSIADVLG